MKSFGVNGSRTCQATKGRAQCYFFTVKGLGKYLWYMTDEGMFVFVVLRYPESPQYLLKIVLTQRKFVVATDSVNFYYPYKELYTRYSINCCGEKMWGIGFRKHKLEEWISYNHINSKIESNGNLHRRKVFTTEIDLSGFGIKQNDFFLVVPNDGAMKEICFGDKISGTKYYHWRCKGVNNVYCKSKSDKELDDYLNKGYRFACKSNIDVYERELFPTHQLIPQSCVLSLL